MWSRATGRWSQVYQLIINRMVQTWKNPGVVVTESIQVPSLSSVSTVSKHDWSLVSCWLVGVLHFKLQHSMIPSLDSRPWASMASFHLDMDEQFFLKMTEQHWILIQNLKRWAGCAFRKVNRFAVTFSPVWISKRALKVMTWWCMCKQQSYSNTVVSGVTCMMCVHVRAAAKTSLTSFCITGCT